MSDFHEAARGGLSATELEAVLRQVGAERYHNRHPFHHRMTERRDVEGRDAGLGAEPLLLPGCHSAQGRR